MPGRRDFIKAATASALFVAAPIPRIRSYANKVRLSVCIDMIMTDLGTPPATRSRVEMLVALGAGAAKS